MSTATFTHKTLVIPAVSMGNIGQLALDLLIYNLSSPSPVHLPSPHLAPLVTNHALFPGLSTPIEVYKTSYPHVYLMQLRSTVLPGHASQQAHDLVEYALEHNFSRIVCLGGASAQALTTQAMFESRWETHRVQAPPPFCTEFPEASLADLHYAGLLVPLLRAAPPLCMGLVRFVFEGSNEPDGEQLARDCLSLLALPQPAVLARPPSWTEH